MKSDLVAPDDLTEEDVRAVKALVQGTASDAQQRLFVDLLVNRLCEVNANCFLPDDRQTSYALGRRYPGLMVRAIALRAVEAFVKPVVRARQKATTGV